MEAKSWQAFSATLWLERSDFGLNDLLGLGSCLGPPDADDSALLLHRRAPRGRSGTLATIEREKVVFPEQTIARWQHLAAFQMRKCQRQAPCLDAMQHRCQHRLQETELMALALRGLTPELSRAAKRLRLE